MGNGVSKISCTHQRFTSSDKKYRRKIVIDKRSIGGPYEFQVSADQKMLRLCSLLG